MTAPSRQYEAGFNWSGITTPTLGATESVGSDNNGADNPALATLYKDYPTNTVPHSLDAGTTCLVVFVGAADDKDVASITWNGIVLTQVVDYYPNLISAQRVVVYKLDSPTGSGALVVTMATGASGRFGAVAMNLIGGTLGTPDTASASAVGHVTSGSVSGDLLINFMIQGGSTAGPIVNAGQVADDGRDVNDTDGSISASGFGASHKAGPGPTTLGWTNAGAFRTWAMVTIPVTASFTDESASLKHFSTQTGRSEELGRVQPSTAIVVLDNMLGRFTPEYVAGPLYGTLELERRARIRGYLADATTRDLFYGFITDIVPDSLAQRTTITLQDWSLFLQQFDLNLGPLISYTTGAIIGAILDAAGFPAGGTWRTLDTGQTTLPYWFARNINAWDAIQEVAEHELGGMFYFDQSGKGIFEDRFNRPLRAVVNTWTNTIGNLIYQRRSTQVYSHAKIILGGFTLGTAGSVIFQYSPLPLAVAPGAYVGNPVDGMSINYPQPARSVITPVATTDYVANSLSTGLGTDRTAGMTLVSFADYGGGAKWLLRNDNLSTVYMQTPLQIRGTPLGLPSSLRTVERTGTPLGTIVRTFEKTYRFLDDAVLAGSWADYIVGHYAKPQPLLQTLIPVDDSVIQQQMYESRASDRQTITDTVFPWRSQVNSDFFIEMLKHEAEVTGEGPGVHRTSWTLTDQGADIVWILGTSALDTTTIAGY